MGRMCARKARVRAEGQGKALREDTRSRRGRPVWRRRLGSVGAPPVTREIGAGCSRRGRHEGHENTRRSQHPQFS